MSFLLIRIDTLEAFPVGDEPLFVGSSAWKVDLCLSGDNVDEVHCELAADPHGVRLSSLCPAGVLVNGQSIQSALLFVNDQVTIGSFVFRVERPGAENSRVIRDLPVSLHANVAVSNESADAEPVSVFVEPLEIANQSATQITASSGHRLERDVTVPPDSQWLVRLGSVELGPLDGREINRMLDRGEVQPTDHICREDRTDWRSVSDFFLDRRLDPDSTSLPDTSHAAVARRSPVVTAAGDIARNAPRQPVSDRPRTQSLPEPQYFIYQTSGEVGPLPRSAVQELVDQGSISEDTPLRLEWSSQWSSSVALGFAFPDSIAMLNSLETAAPPPAASTGTETVSATVGEPALCSESKPSSVQTARQNVQAVTWGLLTPLFYLRSAAYSVRSLSWKNLALLLLVGVTAGFAADVLIMRQARTALTGTLLLGDAPLGDVVVTFNGMSTGEAASGITDGIGRFRIMTLDGKLSPGPYRITVQPQDGARTTVPHGKGKQVVPERYALLATSDVTVDVNGEQTEYRVVLSRYAMPAFHSRDTVLSAQ
ncbi:FHA domain-containing protein [bacterium]|nr:FHA domain-containing protein [bacterium]